MRSSIVARSYAEALFELGERQNAHDDFAQGLNTVTSLLESDARGRAFLETPKIEVAHKKAALRQALQSHVSPVFLNFLLVVLEKRRQKLLRGIAAEYRELLDEKLGRLHVQVSMAHEPDEQTEQTVISELSRILGRTVIPHITVDPSLLGGIVVRYGDNVMDGSLRRQLLSLRQRLVQASLPAAAHSA